MTRRKTPAGGGRSSSCIVDLSGIRNGSIGMERRDGDVRQMVMSSEGPKGGGGYSRRKELQAHA